MAADLARRLLAPLGNRYRHTVSGAARAEELTGAVPRADRELLVVAAWWHDLGYAPELVQTGFHPIDGARSLASQGHSPRLCALVAHRSAATFEAVERDLEAELAEWPREEGPLPEALWTADMTTDQSADVKIVQLMLGHKSATMTLDLYGHLSLTGWTSWPTASTTPCVHQV